MNKTEEIEDFDIGQFEGESESEHLSDKKTKKVEIEPPLKVSSEAKEEKEKAVKS